MKQQALSKGSIIKIAVNSLTVRRKNIVRHKPRRDALLKEEYVVRIKKGIIDSGDEFD